MDPQLLQGSAKLGGLVLPGQPLLHYLLLLGVHLEDVVPMAVDARGASLAAMVSRSRRRSP